MSILDFLFPKKKVSTFESFDINVSKTVVNGSGDNLLWNYIVPPRCQFRFTAFGNDTDTPAAFGSGNISWSIRINRVPLYPYGEIKDKIGFLAIPREIYSTLISGSTLVEIYATNSYGSDIKMGFSLRYDLIYGV